MTTDSKPVAILKPIIFIVVIIACVTYIYSTVINIDEKTKVLNNSKIKLEETIRTDYQKWFRTCVKVHPNPDSKDLVTMFSIMFPNKSLEPVQNKPETPVQNASKPVSELPATIPLKTKRTNPKRAGSNR